MPCETTIFSLIEDRVKKIPHQLLLALASSFVIGLAAHLFCYTNLMPVHDNSWLYTAEVSLAAGATGSRWLSGPFMSLFGNIFQPWLVGVLSLLLYGIASWLIGEICKNRSPLRTVLTAGLVVTSPAVISSHLYLSSLHIYAAALVFACLSVYFLKKYRHGWLLSFLFLFLCEGSYAAYISAALILFFLSSMQEILFEQDITLGRWFRQHLLMFVLLAGSMLASLGFMRLLTANSDYQLQDRIAGAAGQGLLGYVNSVISAYKDAVLFFTPYTFASYFQGQPVLYYLFWIAMLLSALLVIVLLVRRGVWKKAVVIGLLADIAMLPLAMNAIAVLYKAHLLMMFGFIAPWLFVLILSEGLAPSGVFSGLQLRRLRFVYEGVAVLLCAITVLSGCRLANATYTKEYAVYESGVLMLNRVVDRIESTEGYVRGETPVMLLGDFMDVFPRYEGGYNLVASITGSTSTAYNYPTPLRNLVGQVLRLPVNFIFPAESFGGESFATSWEMVGNLLDEQFGSKADLETIQTMADAVDAFPAQNCSFWYNGVLVFKVGEVA